MIVIPMAGLSRRFTEAGYGVPKYMLPLGHATVFDHALLTFARYFSSMPFLIVARHVEDSPSFIAERTAALGIRNVRIVILECETAGQAETVSLGFTAAGLPAESPLTIFNIDTFRPGFAYPDEQWFARSDGYLEVFRGEGPNWSYVAAQPSAGGELLVLETAEKRQISDLCCTGLYHFARAADMLTALAREREGPSSSELFVAPLYNHLIQGGARIHCQLVGTDSVHFCGIPEEYEALRRSGYGLS
jgi:hypothetical protein